MPKGYVLYLISLLWEDRWVESTERIISEADHTLQVAETDAGKHLKKRIADLEKLISAYRKGKIAEQI